MDEFELTFLPKHLPKEVLASPQQAYCDIYLPSTIEHPTLRIRKKGDRYEMTKKEQVARGDASHQRETTIPLTYEEWLELAEIPGKRVQKVRYFYDEDDVSYEIDVFEGDLTGLVVVDVEFTSHNDKASFSPPDWILADVTQEEFIAGGMLCGKTYADIEDDLERFGYKEIYI